MAEAASAIQIQPDAGAGSLTPQQTRFNALALEVAAKRAELAGWKERLTRYDQAVEPVRRQVEAAWRDWVSTLETASLQPGLSRGERAQLDEVIRETAAALGEGEPERGAPGAGAPIEASGEPIDQDWDRQAAARAAQREQRAANRRAAGRQQRAAQATREASQSLRDVYRRLASVLHPDRETDAGQRDRKTTLMQQANDAYAQGNLLALLELQLLAEEIDAAHLRGIAPKRLQHYITVLEEQLAELQAETRRLEAEFRAAVGLGPGTGLQAKKLDRQISAEAQRLRADLVFLRRQIQEWTDIDNVKSWLRDLRRG